jgi:FMN phosphatase YigB (HAD superfamily)
MFVIANNRPYTVNGIYIAIELQPCFSFLFCPQHPFFTSPISIYRIHHDMSKKNLLICFDAFGTLFTPRKPVAQQYSEVARSFGLGGFSDDDIAQSFKKAFKHESKTNPNYGKKTGMGAEKWWGNVSPGSPNNQFNLCGDPRSMYLFKEEPNQLTIRKKIIHSTFAPYYPHTQTTAPPNLIPSLIHRFHSSEGYTLFPDVVPLLKQLRTQQRARRVVIGIITNSDNRTASILTSLGVRVSPLHYCTERPEQSLGQGGKNSEGFDVDFTVLSYDVGAEKPDGRIFGAAEDMLGSLLRREDASSSSSSPDDASAEAWSKVYVGDEYEKDVVGATRAGWKAVLVEREDAAGSGREQREGVEWLGGKRPAAAINQPSSIFDMFARTDAVGVRSLKELGEWLPSSRN